MPILVEEALTPTKPDSWKASPWSLRPRTQLCRGEQVSLRTSNRHRLFGERRRLQMQRKRARNASSCRAETLLSWCATLRGADDDDTCLSWTSILPAEAEEA